MPGASMSIFRRRYSRAARRCCCRAAGRGRSLEVDVFAFGSQDVSTADDGAAHQAFERASEDQPGDRAQPGTDTDVLGGGIALRLGAYLALAAGRRVVDGSQGRL